MKNKKITRFKYRSTRKTSRRKFKLELEYPFQSPFDLDKLFIDILKKACKLTGATASSIWLIDQKTNEIVCRQAIGPKKASVVGWKLSSKQGVIGWVVQNKKSLIISDAMSNKLHYKGVCRKTHINLQSILTVPLLDRYEVIGVIQVVDREPNHFNTADLTLIEPFAVSATVAIENAKLYLKAQNEIIDRKKAEKALRKMRTELEMRVKDRTAELANTNKQLQRDIEKRRKTEKELKFIATHDYLTGAINRQQLNLELKKHLKTHNQNKKSNALLYIDIDDFKKINDKYGHNTGDILLQKIVKIFQKRLQKKGCIARIGGDEFIVLLYGVGKNKAMRDAQLSLRMFKNPIKIARKSIKVTLSIGIVLYPKHGKDLDKLLEKADSAMYQSKVEGKNRALLYSGR